MKYVLMNQANPDLLQPNAGGAAVAVPQLVTITPPMDNTKQDDYVYFHCTMSVASMHRKDGKKLPFINHVHKTNIIEDIQYFDREIAEGNNYIRRATKEEVQRAQINEDPMGAVRQAVKEELSIEELEVLLTKRRAAQAAQKDPNTDANKLAGVDVNTAAKKALQAQDLRTAGSTGTVGGANTASLGMLGKRT